MLLIINKFYHKITQILPTQCGIWGYNIEFNIGIASCLNLSPKQTGKHNFEKTLWFFSVL